jgi:hypothetical protein
MGAANKSARRKEAVEALRNRRVSQGGPPMTARDTWWYRWKFLVGILFSLAIMFWVLFG